MWGNPPGNMVGKALPLSKGLLWYFSSCEMIKKRCERLAQSDDAGRAAAKHRPREKCRTSPEVDLSLTDLGK